MRVDISYWVEVDDLMRADIFFHYNGREGLADEELVRRWFERNAEGYKVRPDESETS